MTLKHNKKVIIGNPCFGVTAAGQVTQFPDRYVTSDSYLLIRSRSYPGILIPMNLSFLFDRDYFVPKAQYPIS